MTFSESQVYQAMANYLNDNDYNNFEVIEKCKCNEN